MARKAFILIVTNDPENGRELRDLLREEHGHACAVVHTLSDARASMQKQPPDVLVAANEVDGRLWGPAELDLLHRVNPDATVVAVGDGPAPETEKLPLVTLPEPSSISELVEPVTRAADAAFQRRRDRIVETTLAETEVREFEGLVGESPQMQRIIERIKKAARNKLTVLILGETGTGKDLIARAIHNCSDRAREPFLSLNCAGLTETLIESQLFGYVKGAFTGAVSDRDGYFAAADGGTLFLDEIGDMPISMQAKLLRVLEHREFTPVGSTEVRRVDVRLIAATNVDLHKRVEEGDFRADLFYRLHQWVMEAPALRERRQDIPLLAQYMLRRANAEHGMAVPGFTTDALQALQRYHWPGNVRELQSVVTATVCEVESRKIDVGELPEEVRGSHALALAPPGGVSSLVGMPLDQMERLMIEQTLEATGGNREQAAKMLNIGTRTLYRKIKEFGLS